jgi:aminopeptidase N
VLKLPNSHLKNGGRINYKYSALLLFNKNMLIRILVICFLSLTLLLTAIPLASAYPMNKNKHSANYSCPQTSLRNDKKTMENSILELGLEQVKLIILKGKPALSFKLIQKKKNPEDLEVDIRVDYPAQAGLKSLETRVEISGEWTRIELELAARPDKLIIDPDFKLSREPIPAEIALTWENFNSDNKKIAVIDEKDSEIFDSFIKKYILANDWKIINEGELTDQQLVNSSVLFFNPGSSEKKRAKGLYGKIEHPDSGLTFEFKKNPFNRKKITGLITSLSPEQIAGFSAVFTDYKNYSYLHFDDGKNKEKKLAPVVKGLTYEFPGQPAGMQLSKAVSFGEIIRELSENRVIYVGESHERYEDHLLQLEIIRQIHSIYPKIAIGMEMFCRSAQPAIDEYIAKESTEEEFLKKSHYFENWGYDYRFFRDIINFSRSHNLPVLGLNLSKDVVRKVYKEGISSLDKSLEKTIPVERDLVLPGYQKRIKPVYRMHSTGKGMPAGQRKKSGNFSGFLQAQSLWDETMAWTAAVFLKNNPEHKLIILAGRGHISKENGIPPRLARQLKVKQAVVVNSEEYGMESDQVDYLFFSSPVDFHKSPLLGVMLSVEGSDVIISGLSPHSKAGRAGIKKDDIFLTIENKPIDSIADIKIILLDHDSGEKIKVKIRRKTFLLSDELLTFEVTL